MKMFGYTNGQIGRWFTQVSGRLDPVSRGWAIVMGGNVGRMALSFVASVLVARALGPAAFGVYAVLGATIAIGSGATLDFIAGNVSRSPTWMSDAGLEWLYRLAREPRRLAHRYLVRDPQSVKIAWRMLRYRRLAP